MISSFPGISGFRRYFTIFPKILQVPRDASSLLRISGSLGYFRFPEMFPGYREIFHVLRDIPEFSNISGFHGTLKFVKISDSRRISGKYTEKNSVQLARLLVVETSIAERTGTKLREFSKSNVDHWGSFDLTKQFTTQSFIIIEIYYSTFYSISNITDEHTIHSHYLFNE